MPRLTPAESLAFQRTSAQLARECDREERLATTGRREIGAATVPPIVADYLDAARRARTATGPTAAARWRNLADRTLTSMTARARRLALRIESKETP